MCYDKAYLTRKNYNYAKRYAHTLEDIEQYERQLKLIPPTYYVSGFSHPNIPIITNENPEDIQTFSWGIIPSFAKDSLTAVGFSNKCLNARGETIFDKPIFKNCAMKKRCLIIGVDGFFEHYHVGKNKYPHFIKLKGDEPMTFAGLWERWENKEQGLVRYTCTIVTTKANALMTKLHNNPAREEGDSRMPVILPKELEREWLKPINDKVDKEMIQSLIQTYPDDLMEAFPVRQLKGKNGVGNSELAIQQFEYPDLDI